MLYNYAYFIYTHIRINIKYFILLWVQFYINACFFKNWKSLLYIHNNTSLFWISLVDGGLSEWSQWSSCEKPCGGSIVNRTRVCDNPPPSNNGAACSGNTLETKMECVMTCPGWLVYIVYAFGRNKTLPYFIKNSLKTPSVKLIVKYFHLYQNCLFICML